MNFDLLVSQGDENCRLCGLCLQKCPYMNVGTATAVYLMKELRAGGSPRKILKACVSCFSCESFCPNHGHPYFTMLSRHQERYTEKGLPESIIFMLTNGDRNFRNCAAEYMDNRSSELLDQWKENENQECFDEVLFPGCNLLTAPKLADSGLFDDVPIAGSFDLCCGEMFFRLGLIQEAEKKARQLETFFAEKKIKTMLFVCPACYNMVKRVLPELFGVNFDFEKLHFVDWILDRISSGDFKVVNPIGGTYSIHDSCHARVMDEPFTHKVRKLIYLLGGEVEQRSIKAFADGYCCGIAAGAKSHSVVDVIKVAAHAMKRLNHGKKAKAVAYCNGCSLTMTLTGIILPGSVDITHLIHLVSKAGGYKDIEPMKTLARPAVNAIVRNGLPRLLSIRRRKLSVDQ